ncbi:MAG: hypothetical protein RR709_06910, partial [Ruthenibacterium sp.]
MPWQNIKIKNRARFPRLMPQENAPDFLYVTTKNNIDAVKATITLLCHDNIIAPLSQIIQKIYGKYYRQCRANDMW